MRDESLENGSATRSRIGGGEGCTRGCGIRLYRMVQQLNLGLEEEKVAPEGVRSDYTEWFSN